MNQPKIAGFIAEKKNIIVFIYRKTNKINYLIRMDYYKNNEKLHLGSRFYGRFYPSRCDISPDGRHFLYFAMGHSKKYQKNFPAWTAICSPPQITAQFLLGHYDTWGGGGAFLSENKIFINNTGAEPLSNEKFNRYRIKNKDNIQETDFKRDDGWRITETQQVSANSFPPKFIEKTTKNITIKKKYEYHELYGKGKNRGEFDMYSYTFINNNTKDETEIPICQWADFDNFGRLLLACGSEIKIYKNYRQLSENKPIKSYDFEELMSN